MKKILIIGAGVNQLSIIKTAKSLGYYVIVVSSYEAPGLAIADEAIEEDIFNVDKIIEIAKKREISGVLAESDIATPIVAKVAEALHLPTFGYDNAIAFTDKSRMREVFTAIGLPVAKNYEITSFEELEKTIGVLEYPIVLKPVDSFASRGVIRVNSNEDLAKGYDFAMSASRSKRIIAEEYISGPQYFSQGFVGNGKFRMFAYSDRYYFDLPDLFLPYTNAFPANISSTMMMRMESEFAKVINYLKPLFGHVWAEWIYDSKNDKLYIIEMAIRGAGALVTSDVIPNAYGVDTQPYLIKAAMGENVDDFFTAKLENNAAAFYTFILPEGEVIECNGLDKYMAINGVVASREIKINVGDKISKPKDKTSRFGPIVVKGTDRDDLEKIKNVLIDTIDIKVKTEDGIKRPIWK